MFTIKDKNGLGIYKINYANEKLELNKLQQLETQYQPLVQNKNILISYNENNIKIYDLKTQKLILEQQQSEIQKIFISPENKYIIIKTQQKNLLYQFDNNKLQLISEEFPAIFVFSNNDQYIFAQSKQNLQLYQVEDKQLKLLSEIQVYMKKYEEMSLSAKNNLVSVSSIPQKQVQGFYDFYKVENNKIAKVYSFIIQQASQIDVQLEEQYGIVQIYGQFGGASYYGSKRLLLIDLNRQRQIQIVKASLNDWTLMDYDNNYNTKLLVTSEKTPSQIKVTYITNQKSSNTLIVKTEEISGYQKLYINKLTSLPNVCLLRGEASMDGHLYIGVVKNSKFQLVKMLDLHYITDVQLTNQFIILSTQYPRYTIDNQIKFFTYQFKELQTLQYEKLNFVKLYEENQNIDQNILQELKKIPQYQEQVENKADVFVPSCVRQQQQQQVQTQKACRSSSGWW